MNALDLGVVSHMNLRNGKNVSQYSTAIGWSQSTGQKMEGGVGQIKDVRCSPAYDSILVFHLSDATPSMAGQRARDDPPQITNLLCGWAVCKGRPNSGDEIHL